jgi:hypothetical protein
MVEISHLTVVGELSLETISSRRELFSKLFLRRSPLSVGDIEVSDRDKEGRDDARCHGIPGRWTLLDVLNDGLHQVILARHADVSEVSPAPVLRCAEHG